MATKNSRIRISCGLKDTLPVAGAQTKGQLKYCTDTKELYIDDGSDNQLTGGAGPLNTLGTDITKKQDKLTANATSVEQVLLKAPSALEGQTPTTRPITDFALSTELANKQDKVADVSSVGAIAVLDANGQVYDSTTTIADIETIITDGDNTKQDKISANTTTGTQIITQAPNASAGAIQKSSSINFNQNFGLNNTDDFMAQIIAITHATTDNTNSITFTLNAAVANNMPETGYVCGTAIRNSVGNVTGQLQYTGRNNAYIFSIAGVSAGSPTITWKRIDNGVTSISGYTSIGQVAHTLGNGIYNIGNIGLYSDRPMNIAETSSAILKVLDVTPPNIQILELTMVNNVNQAYTTWRYNKNGVGTTVLRELWEDTTSGIRLMTAPTTAMNFAAFCRGLGVGHFVVQAGNGTTTGWNILTEKPLGLVWVAAGGNLHVINEATVRPNDAAAMTRDNLKVYQNNDHDFQYWTLDYASTGNVPAVQWSTWISDTARRLAGAIDFNTYTRPGRWYFADNTHTAASTNRPRWATVRGWLTVRIGEAAQDTYQEFRDVLGNYAYRSGYWNGTAWQWFPWNTIWGKNTQYSPHEPNTWPVAVEVQLGDNLYGLRRTGIINSTNPSPINIELLASGAIALINRGGQVDMSINNTNVYSVGDFWYDYDINQRRGSGILKDTVAGRIRLWFTCDVNGAHNYDVWVTYRK